MGAILFAFGSVTFCAGLACAFLWFIDRMSRND